MFSCSRQKKISLMHVTDWLPTLLDAVRPGLSEANRQKLDFMKRGDLDLIDGVSHWPNFEDPDARDERTEMLYNIDPGSTQWAKFKFVCDLSKETICVRSVCSPLTTND